MNVNLKLEEHENERKEMLSLEVTNHCNSSCSHCFVQAANSVSSELSLKLVKDILTEGYALNYSHLHITGGEPLLWEGLFEALEYAFTLGYKKILINTNGTMLEENVVSRFSEFNGLSISVSMQGPETFHDKVRGKGSFKKTLQGVENAHDSGLNLYIFATVFKSLLPLLPHFAFEIYDKFPGIDCLTLIQLIRVQDDVFDLSHELLEPSDFIELVHMAALLNFYGHKTEILNNPLGVVVSELLKIRRIPNSTPLHRKGNLIVKANRDISLAHSTRMNFGKYEFGMLEDVRSCTEYRNMVSPDEACSPCKYHDVCRNCGMVRPSEWFRDMNTEIPYCKRVLDKAAIWH